MKKRVLFQLSGSIACYKACIVLSRLVQEGFEARVACTPGALRFVGAPTLEGLSGHAVFADAFEAGRAMDHIELARWADLAVLCPASASALNRLSAGIADDAIGALFLAWELRSKPYLVAPAMNAAMWDHPATRESVAKLGGWGVGVIAPDSGRLACGELGEGRLAEPGRIFEEIALAARGPRA